ncbi:hypothetical protein Pst134EB_021857 [Puccinia striiformis f. sp. tritici]|nr:hypothetical protein Pst134EB_021857 [Puccinia striiformis f. sp. tritici]
MSQSADSLFDGEENEPVRAYAKLEFPQHDFFIRKLSIIIGRRPPTTTSDIKLEEIDVDLGPIRAVSRKHAALFYDSEFGRWCIEVLGRNGCVVDGRWKARSEIIPLRFRTKIQIAERIFYFILPEPPSSPAVVVPAKVNDNNSNHLISPCEFDCEAPDKPPDSEEEEESNSESEDDDDDDDQLPKSEDEPRPPSPPRHEGLNYDQNDRIDFNLIRSESESDSMDDDESLELTQFPGKAPASKAPRKTNTASKAPHPGRGKTDHHYKPQEEESSPSIIVPSGTAISDLEPPKPGSRGGKGKSNLLKPSKAPAGQQKSSAEIALPIKERPKIMATITPAGAEIGTATQKPPYTYASLITQALAAQADEDGKMLVSEMCEWMAGVYPFYGAKEKGSDWQSAVRHNLNADKRFKRIERMPTDGGKGNFWTLREEEWVNFDGLELRRQKEIKTTTTRVETKAKETIKTVVGRQLDGAPSRSIGTVARSDIGAHHRTTTNKSTSPTRPSNSHGIRPPPSTPAPTPTSDLPVFSAPDDLPVNPSPTKILHQDSYDQPDPYQFDNEPSFDPTPISNKTPPPPPSLPPPIDPNLLACTIPSPSITRPPLKTTVVPTKPKPSILTVKPATLPTPTPPKPKPKPTTTNTGSKFEIIIQEPTKSSMFNSTPKTQEELKKLIEADPPMYVTGNKLILNKLIFKELKVNQIQSLQKLGPTSAIKILQKFIIGYFKERIKKTSASASSGSGSGMGSSKDTQTQKSNGTEPSSQLHPDNRHSTDPQLSCPNLNPTSSPLITSNPTSSSSSSSDTTTTTHPSSSLLKRKTCHFSTPSTTVSTTLTPDSNLINPDFFNAESLSALVNPDLTSNPNSTGEIHSKKIKLNPG